MPSFPYFYVDALPFEIIKMLSLPRATENFAQILRRQVDMTIEGSNLKQFRDNFDSQHKCSFPQPIMFSKCCLVEEYIDAKPISHFLFDESVEGREIRKKIAGPLLRAFLKMVFVDNFVHCDLHPGNVLVHENTTTRTPIPTSNSPFSFLLAQNEDKTLNHQETNYSVVFLDAGIATSLNKRDQTNLKDLFRAILLNDGALAGRLMVERARYENCSSKEGGVEAFSQGIADIVTEFHTRRKEGLTLGVVRIGSLLGQVLDLCRIHGVEIDPAMANIVISTFVLEGLGRSLEPNLNLFDCALPFVMGKV
jgi:aarF domain-containing kinase